ncbi:MAG: dihydroxy-acid dehydratase, partial [Candidatus Dormibacteria bacterium]
PGLVLYGGSIAQGRFRGRDVDVKDVFEAIGALEAGRITEADLRELEDVACPGAGACGGQYTANTMALVMEFIGLSPMGSASVAALDPAKQAVGEAAGRLVMEMLTEGRSARGLLTRASFDNGIAGVAATGGSTNAVLHLLAIAHAANVPLNIDDFETIRQRTRVLCDLKPSGRYVTTEFHRAGGVPQVMKMLLAHGILHGGEKTITGRTIAETLAEIPEAPRKDQNVIRPWANPMYAEGHLAILRGNLATEGAVAKITGIKHQEITGPARVFDREEDTLDAILGGRIKKGDVLVIRYEGPKGGPGMREMLSPTSAIIGAGLGDSVGLITDGRFSGGT